MLKKILDVIVGLIVIGALGAFVFFMLQDIYYRNAEKIQCETNCSPLQYKIMEAECFCKGPDIWFKKGSISFRSRYFIPPGPPGPLEQPESTNGY